MASSHKGKAVILLYHQIGLSPIKQTNLDCYCNQDRFEEQMAYLYDSHYKVITLDELVLKINSQMSTFKDSYVVLTFDDGCDKFSEMALPILEKYNFLSTMYPVVGSLGKVASWPKVFNPDLNIVSELELKQLSSQGVNIGAHTMNHLKLTTCGFNEAKEEIEQSKQALELIIGKKVTSFSYPHGDYNEDVCSLIKTLGFSNAVTCNSNFINSDSDLFHLPRKYVTYFDTLDTFKNILNYE
jgi:peptidoglycan/xylan/chitin deacetylase (PgdA/CDA1 family)